MKVCTIYLFQQEQHLFLHDKAIQEKKISINYKYNIITLITCDYNIWLI